MLFESEQFELKIKKPASWRDNVFRYCEFKGINTEGGDADSVFISCNMNECEWYWGLFNMAVFIDVKFNNCRFRGTSFSGSKFVDCEFKNCVFSEDNLNGDCSFDDVVWYGCSQEECTGLKFQA